MTLDNLRQAVGAYALIPVVWGFQSTDGAGALGLLGVDTATIAEDTFTPPWPGFVAGWSAVSTGGNFDGAHFQIQIGGTAQVDTDFVPAAAALDTGVFHPSVCPFAADDALTLEMDAVGTARDCIVTVFLALNVGA